MKTVIIEHKELWPCYYIKDPCDPDSDDNTIDVSEQFLKYYEFVMNNFRLLQNTLSDLEDVQEGYNDISVA